MLCTRVTSIEQEMHCQAAPVMFRASQEMGASSRTHIIANRCGYKVFSFNCGISVKTRPARQRGGSAYCDILRLWDFLGTFHRWTKCCRPLQTLFKLLTICLQRSPSLNRKENGCKHDFLDLFKSSVKQCFTSSHRGTGKVKRFSITTSFGQPWNLETVRIRAARTSCGELQFGCSQLGLLPPAVMESSKMMDTTISGVPTFDPLTASFPVRRPSSRMLPAPPLERIPMYTIPGTRWMKHDETIKKIQG